MTKKKNERFLTRQESRDLGRAEYWNPKNKGKSLMQVWSKFVKDGRTHVWKSEFLNGWYGATMLADDEPDIVPPPKWPYGQ